MKRRSNPTAGSGRTLLPAALLAASCFGIGGFVLAGDAEASSVVSAQDGAKQKGADAKKQDDATAKKNADAAKKQAAKKQAAKKQAVKNVEAQKKEAMKKAAEEKEAQKKELAKKRSARSRLKARPRRPSPRRSRAPPRFRVRRRAGPGWQDGREAGSALLSPEKKKAPQKDYEDKASAAGQAQSGSMRAILRPPRNPNAKLGIEFRHGEARLRARASGRSTHPRSA